MFIEDDFGSREYTISEISHHLAVNSEKGVIKDVILDVKLIQK